MILIPISEHEKKNYLDFISPVKLHLYVKIKVDLTTRNDVHTSMRQYKLMVQVFNFYIYNMDGFNSSQEPEQSSLLSTNYTHLLNTPILCRLSKGVRKNEITPESGKACCQIWCEEKHGRTHFGSGSTAHPAVDYKGGAATQGGSPPLIQDQPSGFCVGPTRMGTP